jgi:hypothetical protein
MCVELREDSRNPSLTLLNSEFTDQPINAQHRPTSKAQERKNDSFGRKPTSLASYLERNRKETQLQSIKNSYLERNRRETQLQSMKNTESARTCEIIEKSSLGRIF